MSRDRQWFDSLYQQHHDSVFSYCLRRVSPADAHDVSAEVFTVAWRRRDDIPVEPLPWLYGVARRVLSHHWRSRSRADRLVRKAGGQHTMPDDGPDVVTERNHEHALVREAVVSLRPIDREVLMLAAWEGLDHRQIAAVLDCSVAAIDKRMVRARQRLAERYETLTSSVSLPPPSSNSRSSSRNAPARTRKGGGST